MAGSFGNANSFMSMVLTVINNMRNASGRLRQTPRTNSCRRRFGGIQGIIERRYHGHPLISGPRMQQEEDKKNTKTMTFALYN